MKKSFVVLAVLIAIIALWPIPKLYAADGKELYQTNNCVMCHGADGKGNPMMAQMFNVDGGALNLTVTAKKRNDQELSGVIKDGKGKMPPFKNISPAELKALVQYLRSLK